MASCWTFLLLLLSSVLISETSAACLEGWKSHGGRCFLMVGNPRTMAQAEVMCQDVFGAHLASVHSPDENHFVVTLTTDRNPQNLWTYIGLFDALEDGTWLYTDGSKAVFSNWAPGEPNNFEGRREDCVVVNYKGNLWNDVPCDEKRPFVCAMNE